MHADQSLILSSLYLDFLGPVGLLECVDGLLEALWGWCYRAHHDCAGLAAEWVFEEARQFGVAVGDEHALFVGVAECVDAVGEGQEGSVDLGALAQSDASVFGHGASFWTSQVYKG